MQKGWDGLSKTGNIGRGIGDSTAGTRARYAITAPLERVILNIVAGSAIVES